jgi:glycosyltransferase involved in cell wall biosynthesis
VKVAYLIHWNDGPESGVWKKVQTQVSWWHTYGAEVGVFLITRSNHSYTLPESIPLSIYPNKSARGRLRAWHEAVVSILKGSVDLVYLRYDLFYPSLWLLKGRVPVILEVNTDDEREYCLEGGARCCYNRLTRKLLFQMASGYAVVSRELASRVPKCDFKAVCVIGNGIDLSQYTPLPPSTKPIPHLVFMGSEGQPWHGVDKVLLLARSLQAWQFHIIGPPPLPGAPANVKFHGFLSKKEYEEVLAHCDVALGTLALHRNGMNEASPLKVREYLAYGLPVILGHQDTDFPSGAPFILEIPNREDNVTTHLREIERFVASWNGKRIPRPSVQHLDVRLKEKTRLEFFERVVASWRGK